MRTKARDGFIKALRDAHRWLDELLVDPTQTIESLAIREDKSERSIRMTLSLAFMSPALGASAMVSLTPGPHWREKRPRKIVARRGGSSFRVRAW